MKIGKISIDNSDFMHYDVAAVDQYEGTLVYASIIGNSNLIKNISKKMRRKLNCYIQNYFSCSISGKYDIDKEKLSNEDFSHLVIKHKDDIDNKNKNNERYKFYVMYKTEDELKDILYDKLYANTSVPLQKEWIDKIYNSFLRLGLIKNIRVLTYYEEFEYKFCRVFFTASTLLNIVQELVKNGEVKINDKTEVSETMQEITGLDSYLNNYGDILANKIQKAFVPEFDPQKDNYDEYVNNYDDSCYYNGIDIYDAQKAVIQSSVNNLNHNKTTIVVGEMGVGKTMIGSGIVYSHYKKKSGSSNVILCPGHLVEKWKREVESLIPNAKAYIIENIKQVINLKNKIKNKNKKEHMFLILSKDTAKFSYEKRPSAIWSISKKCFVCPKCGKPLFKEETETIGSRRYKKKVYLKELDFLKELSYNLSCQNEIVKIDKNGKKQNIICGEKLWTPVNRYDNDCDWIKLGNQGWIMKKHFNFLYNDYYTKAANNTLNKKEQIFLSKMIEKKQELDETGELNSSTKGVRKYSIAKYIRERLKGYIDYFIADELDIMAPHTVMCA